MAAAASRAAVAYRAVAALAEALAARKRDAPEDVARMYGRFGEICGEGGETVFFLCSLVSFFGLVFRLCFLSIFCGKRVPKWRPQAIKTRLETVFGRS